jgi:hypothetical protein
MTDAELDNPQIIEKALHALFSIDELAGKIALHGGQALIAYNISHRASQDIDLFWFNCFLWFWSGSFFGFGRGAC